MTVKARSDTVTLIRVNDGAMIPYSNLVVNGFGEKKTLAPFGTYDVIYGGGKFVLGDAPIDCYGYFNGCASDLIPYDQNTEYVLSYWSRLKKNLSSGKAYFALFPCDIDKKFIEAIMTPALNDYTYKLAKDVEAGDEYIYFEDLTNWSTGIYEWVIAFYNYTDSTGYTYPVGTYTRNVIDYKTQSNLDKANNRIKLASPYSGATIPKSTPVMQHKYRSTYPYYGQMGACTSHEWKHWTNLSIKQTDDVTLKVTKYLRLGFTNDVADFAGVSLMPKGAKGDTGPKGPKGDMGDRGPSGISSFLHIAYANSNDGQIGFSHTWSKSKTWVGHYVTDTNEADSNDPSKYTWIKWVGDDGIGITDIIEYYNVNNSATTAPTRWSTTVQQPNATNRYLWNYEEIKFSSGESHKSTPRIIGVYSNSITKITPYYYLSNSRDTFTLVNGHSWTTTIPNISDGEYLWEKMIVTFDNGSTKETEPVLHGEYNALSDGMNIISSNVGSQIDNAQDHILQQVYSTYATKDALNEYKASMNTQFGIYDGKISANISELNSVKSNVAGLTETANNVNNYMTFDKNGLSLGKSDSDFKTNITNEKLAFLQNGNEVAYFANNQMYVTDGNFANSMTIGKFAFVPRANGSLDFKKVGK